MLEGTIFELNDRHHFKTLNVPGVGESAAGVRKKLERRALRPDLA